MSNLNPQQFGEDDFDFLAKLDTQMSGYVEDAAARERIAPSNTSTPEYQQALTEDRDFVIHRLQQEAPDDIRPWISKNTRGVPEIPCPTCDRDEGRHQIYNSTQLERELAPDQPFPSALQERFTGRPCASCRLPSYGPQNPPMWGQR